jgi:hypothetical protein
MCREMRCVNAPIEVNLGSPVERCAGPPTHMCTRCITELGGLVLNRPTRMAPPRWAGWRLAVSCGTKVMEETESAWRGFVNAGDDWITMYALACIHGSWMASSVIGPRLFSIGHAAELYLKGARLRLTGDLRGTVARGHDVAALLADCQQADPTLLPRYQLRPNILADDKLFSGGDVYERLGRDDFFHLVEHQELYLVAHMLLDLKYFGAQMKRHKGALSFAAITPSDYWMRFFSELRAYLRMADSLRFEFLIDFSSRPGCVLHVGSEPQTVMWRTPGGRPYATVLAAGSSSSLRCVLV